LVMLPACQCLVSVCDSEIPLSQRTLCSLFVCAVTVLNGFDGSSGTSIVKCVDDGLIRSCRSGGGMWWCVVFDRWLSAKKQSLNSKVAGWPLRVLGYVHGGGTGQAEPREIRGGFFWVWHCSDPCSPVSLSLAIRDCT
jgi:hypothetical protein